MQVKLSSASKTKNLKLSKDPWLSFYEEPVLSVKSKAAKFLCMKHKSIKLLSVQGRITKLLSIQGRVYQAPETQAGRTPACTV